MSSNLVIFNVHLVDEELDFNGAVYIENGKIKEIFKGEFPTKGKMLLELAEKSFSIEETDFYDGNGLHLMPAFIDMHVHLRYPGQTEKEDLKSGLMAAAAGGVGTLIAMPNTNPVVSSPEIARTIEEKAKELNLVNMFQAISITDAFDGKTVENIENASREITPVITEDGRDVLDSGVMLAAMKKAGKKDIIVSCHSEDPTLVPLARKFRTVALQKMEEFSIPSWGVDAEDRKIPAEENSKIDSMLSEANRILAVAEDSYTERNLLLAEIAKCHVHIAHVSTKNSIDAIRRAKKRTHGKYKVSCEITPHHLALCGTFSPELRALVNPPLRSEEDRLALIEALKDGTADVISTDHAPHTLQDKAKGAPGFSGIEVSYAVCNTVLVKQNGFSECELSKLMSAQAARLLKFEKGRLSVGYDADFVLVNPDEEWTVCGKEFYSKGKATPFEGKKLFGKVHATFIPGTRVFNA